MLSQSHQGSKGNQLDQITSLGEPGTSRRAVLNDIEQQGGYIMGDEIVPEDIGGMGDMAFLLNFGGGGQELRADRGSKLAIISS
jgi:hypothetical protein